MVTQPQLPIELSTKIDFSEKWGMFILQLKMPKKATCMERLGGLGQDRELQSWLENRRPVPGCSDNCSSRWL